MKINRLLKNFVLPMAIGYGIGLIAFFSTGITKSIMLFIVKVLYTVSANYLVFLMWFAPLMVMVFLISASNNIKDSFSQFIVKYFMYITITSLLIAIVTLVISYVLVPVINYLPQPDLLQDKGKFIDPFFEMKLTGLDLLGSIFLGCIIGVFAKRDSQIMKIATEAEAIINVFIQKVLLPLVPVWLIGTFAASTAVTSFGVVVVDLYLSVIVITIQLLWLLVMYLFASKVNGISVKKLIKAASKIYVTVITFAGNSVGMIIPITVAEQKEIGLDEDIAKFVTSSSFNLPGSLIAHIVFVVGIIQLFGTEVTIYQLLLYVFALVFVLIAAPAIPGAVFAITSQLLTPMLGFTESMTNLMGTFYYKQGTTNACVNNCADFYVTPIFSKKQKKITEETLEQ